MPVLDTLLVLNTLSWPFAVPVPIRNFDPAWYRFIINTLDAINLSDVQNSGEESGNKWSHIVAIHSTEHSGNFGPKFGPPEKLRKYWSTFWSGPLLPVGPVWSKTTILIPSVSRFGISWVFTRRKMAASLYRCSLCDITLPSLENLLSHECQGITGKCLVYLQSCCFCQNNNNNNRASKKSVCVLVSTATIPAKTNATRDADISASNFIVFFFE